MRASRPDLAIPILPDPEDLHPHARSQHVDQGGMSLRQDDRHRPQVTDMGEIDWPEAGPSSIPADGPSPEGSGSIGPFGAKLIAAMTGASTTSLLMTPFDVLKTRLQTHQPHPTPTWTPPSADCCQTSLLTSAPSTSSRSFPTSRLASASVVASSSNAAILQNPLTCITSASPSEMSNTIRISMLPSAAGTPSGCAFPSKWAGIWGEAITLEEAMARNLVGVGGNGATSTLVLPQDTWGSGFWEEVGAVYRDAGVKGLWKGVGTTLTMSIPSSAIYMLGYEHLLTQISPYWTNSSDPASNVSSINARSGDRKGLSASLTPAPLLAGSMARTISASVISPIEMFRTRLQALPTSAGTPTYASTAKDMGKLVSSQGITVLWRGLGPTLWRDVPFSGIYWAGFEILKTSFSSPSSPLSTSNPLTTSFLSGAISGTISALLTQPFDVLKTRRQVFTPNSKCSPEALRSRASTIPLAMHVIKTEGWSALFAGTVPRCGKVAPACGLMIACYEGVGRYLNGGG